MELLDKITRSEYAYGFTTDIDSDKAPNGLNEEIIRFISAKKKEPEWMTEWRLDSYRKWKKMQEPDWANLQYPPPDFDAISYYSAPKPKKKLNSLDEVDPELLKTFDKLGISLEEQKRLSGVAMDVVVDSVSVKTTFKEKLAELGIIFCSMSEAIQEHPDLVRKYLGTVVPKTDNYYAGLNSAVFTDGSFCYIPKGVRCPMELSTYFRINEAGTGQFERTLLIADEGSYVSYLEGCTAPMRDENQLHAAVVELVALEGAEIKYSTVQNWYPGDAEGKGGVFNFVTKRGICHKKAKISWTQVETGSAVTWKYPSCILKGEHSVGEFYSVAVTNNRQQADTGTKMIHLGRNTRSTIISKGICARKEQWKLPRACTDGTPSAKCPKLQPMRLIADGRRLRIAHLPVHRDQESDSAGGTRSHHFQDRRRPTFLLQPKRYWYGGGDRPDRQWICPGSLEPAAHGICSRSQKITRRLARGIGRLMKPIF